MKLRVALYCLLGGLPFTIAALGTGHFAWWWLSGILMSAAFVPAALFGPKQIFAQIGVIFPVFLIVTLLCTWSEAWIFSPGFREQAVRNLSGVIILYVIAAAALAVLSTLLKLNRPSETRLVHRPSLSAPFFVLLSGFSYLIYYFVFGAITYQFFTKVYYPNAQQVAGGLGVWFWGIQIVRGVLMTLSVLPMIYTLRMKRWHAAIAVGLVIWITGGAGPLLVPVIGMGVAQRLIHTVEIFTQNFLLGVTTVMLLCPKSPKVAENPQAASPVGV